MKGLFIDGRVMESFKREAIPVISPATGEIFEEVSRGGAEDIDKAVDAGHSALCGEWGNFSATARGRILMRIGERILENSDELARIEAHDTGKPTDLARKDIKALARYFEFYGSAADKIYGQVIPYSTGYAVSVVREPYGVVGHIIPWNYPAQMLGRTVAPALAMGNASVVKPAEDACLTALRFAEIATDAGLPSGALNIVTGYGSEAGEALSSHPGINMITFTGSPAIGSRIQACASRNHVKCVLELGGKCPQIVFNDANVEKAIPLIVGAIIQNAGQTCSAGSRVLIQEGIYEEVTEKVAHEFRQLKVGGPDNNPDCGPIITPKQFEIVNNFIMDCKNDGINLIAEGSLCDGLPDDGFYIKPSFFGSVPRDHKLAKEEVFGPVLAAIPFEDEEDAIAIANGTDYGLVASVWTENGSRQQRMARHVDTGQMFINCYGAGGGIELPFGGVRGSGHGREKGFIALEEFSHTKTIVQDYT